MMVNMSAEISFQDAVTAPRSHAEIIRSIGAQNLRKALEAAGLDVPSPSGVQQWVQRDSIPGEYWNAFARAGFATLEELAAYAETKKATAPAIKETVNGQ